MTLVLFYCGKAKQLQRELEILQKCGKLNLKEFIRLKELK